MVLHASFFLLTCITTDFILTTLQQAEFSYCDNNITLHLIRIICFLPAYFVAIQHFQLTVITCCNVQVFLRVHIGGRWSVRVLKLRFSFLDHQEIGKLRRNDDFERGSWRDALKLILASTRKKLSNNNVTNHQQLHHRHHFAWEPISSFAGKIISRSEREMLEM